MKTISMYLRAAKTEAEDAGESVDGMAGSVSELRSEILALTGNRVDVMLDADSFKSTYQIMKELAGVWDELTDVSRANILEMVGGKRNANVVAALLENFETVEEVMESASDAEGSALAENEKYLESIQGHISEFKAEFQELSTNVVDSDIVKMVVDIGTGLVAVASSLSDINALLPAILVTVVAINAVHRAQAAERLARQAVEATASTAARLIAEKTATESLVASYRSLGRAYQQIVLHRIQNAALSGAITEQTKDEIITTLELAAAQNNAAASGETLAKSSIGLRSVLGAVSPVGWVLTALSLLPMLIPPLKAIGQEMGIIEKSNDELIQAGKDLKTSYGNSIDEAADNLKTLRGLQSEFNELSSGVGASGENISLAADDYERYRDIVNTIADITPSLISGYDAEGNAIANKNGLLEKSIELMEEEQRLKKQEFVSNDNLGDIGMGEKAALIEYQKEYNGGLVDKAAFAGALHSALAGADMAGVYDALGATTWDGWDANIGKFEDRANGFATIYYEQVVQALRQNRNILSDYLSETDVDNLLALADEYDRNAEVYRARMEEYSKALNPTLQQVPQTLTVYNDLSDAQKEFLTSYINSFRITADTTKDDILQMKRDILALTEFVAENGDMEDTIRIGMSIKYGTDANGKSLSVDEYRALIEQFLTQISGYDAETQVRIKAAFGIETDDDQINDEAEKAIAHVRNLLIGGDSFGNEVKQAYNDYQRDLQDAASVGVDLSKTVYGNIDTETRQILDWTGKNLLKYKEALQSWAEAGESWSDIRQSYVGSYSTIDAASADFGGIEVAFTPMLQTENGAEYLDKNTVYNYIDRLLEMAKADGNWTPEEILALDATGIEQDGRVIKGIIADVGDTAAKTAESMHYVGNLGAIADDYQRLEAAASAAGYSAEQVIVALKNGESVEDMIGDLTIDDVMQIYYNISADPNSMTIDELLKKLDELKAAAPSTAASSLINSAAPVQKNITALSDALDDFKKSGSLSGSALSELTEVFGALPSFDAAANTLASTSTTAAEAKAALEQLAKEYLESGNSVGSILDQLTEDNKELTIAMLEQMGVVDAAALVQDRLDYNKLIDSLSRVTEETRDATIAMLEQNGVANAAAQVDDVLAAKSIQAGLANMDLANRTEDVVRSLAAEAGGAISAQRAVELLSDDLLAAKIGSTDFVEASLETTESLLAEAEAAGIACANLKAIYAIKESVDKYGTGGLTGSELRDRIESLQAAAQKEAAAVHSSLVDAFSLDFNINLSGLGGGSSGASALEKYTADIDEFREALERLERIQANKELLELDLSHTDDLTEQIRLERDLANVYEHEAQVVKELIGLRTTSIQDKIGQLQQRGFDIEYNAEKNWLYVRNLEHLNELQKGGTESTNEYRKETEELIEAVEELNEENREAVSTWKELEYSIREAKEKIVENLKSIVSETSEAIDSIQSVYDTLKEAADEYAANDGFISVDAFQKIVELGPQYMQYLRDENGLLVINEENINKVIAAKTQQLALEQAMTYVERLRLALNKSSLEDLNNLLYATVETTNATWGLVYANLALLDLSDSQRQAALHNINAIRAMADNAIEGLGRTSGSALDTLNDMKSGLDDILKYVMDMLQDEVERQIDALEDEKDAYAELIDLKKQSLEETEKETDYQDEVAAKIKEIAKLQERINALSLDNSRDAQAKRVALEEEMAELQKELADTQADYAKEAQQDSLDKMQEAYEAEKDKEIEKLENSISSEQKLYDKAISYINENWSTLYDDLIAWNTEYGNVLNQEITTAWENCLAAAQRYGSYVNALNNIDADIAAASGESNNVIVGSTNYDSSYGSDEMVHAIIKQMYENMNEHGGSGSSTSPERKKQLSQENLALGEQLHAYGINAYRDERGMWWTAPSKTTPLFEAYKKYTYHSGGIAGDRPTLKQNELFAKLEEGEAIFNSRHQEALWKILNFTSELSEKFRSMLSGSALSELYERIRGDELHPSHTETTSNTSIHFGDVYVYGANDRTVEAHREVNRQFANEVLKQLNIKR